MSHTKTQMKTQAKLQLDSGNIYNSSMEITDVTLDDAGKYKVIAKNDVGECSASISLNFDSKSRFMGVSSSCSRLAIISLSFFLSFLLSVCVSVILVARVSCVVATFASCVSLNLVDLQATRHPALRMERSQTSLRNL